MILSVNSGYFLKHNFRLICVTCIVLIFMLYLSAYHHRHHHNYYYYYELVFVKEGMHGFIDVAELQELIHCRKINECRITLWGYS